MILVTQDLPSIALYINDTLSLYSRCGIGDLLILRDYAVLNDQDSSLKKCEHCGSLVGSDDSAIFRGGKKFLHLRFLKTPFDQRNKETPDYLHSILIPFIKNS